MSRLRCWPAVLLAAVLLCSFGADAAAGQVALLPRQGLTFGELTPGVASKVSAQDGARRAELELVGTGQVVLTALLPPALVSPSGGLLPVVFGPGDGQVRLLKGNSVLSFDPTESFAFRIPPGQEGAHVWIGGTALPQATQARGTYQAQIVVQILTPGT